VTNLSGGNQFSRTGGTCANGVTLVDNGTCTVILNRVRPTTLPRGGTGKLTIADSLGSQVLNLSGN
jgi:hypothetical protein